MISLIIYGIIIGILVSAPIGPIAVLCVQRSLNLGFKAGFITGLGSALADGVFGLISACGLTFISDQLTIYQTELHCLSGFILLYLGIRQYLKNPKTPHITEHQQSSWSFLIGAFLLSLSNSAAILLFELLDDRPYFDPPPVGSRSQNRRVCVSFRYSARLPETGWTLTAG